MSLQGKSEEEIRALETTLLTKIGELGGSASNIALQRALNWEENEYWPIRDRLVDLGSLRRYRARGGAVTLVPPSQPIQSTQIEPQQPVVQHSAALNVPLNGSTERDLYEPVAAVLRGQWARDSRFRHQIVEITASQGRRNTGGTWTRPDIVVAALRIFPFLPGKFFDLITFEIKPTWAVNVTAVYEALAHRRAATQSYVWLHCQGGDQEKEALTGIKEEAERHGIGVIVATDPADYDTWDTIAEPARVEPDPETLNEFIALQVTDGAKEELAAWVR